MEPVCWHSAAAGQAWSWFCVLLGSAAKVGTGEVLLLVRSMLVSVSCLWLLQIRAAMTPVCAWGTPAGHGLPHIVASQLQCLSERCC